VNQWRQQWGVNRSSSLLASGSCRPRRPACFSISASMLLLVILVPLFDMKSAWSSAPLRFLRAASHLCKTAMDSYPERFSLLLSGFPYDHLTQQEILNWLRAFKKFPSQVFLNHGEPYATHAIADAIRREFDSKVIIPEVGQSFRLE